ncbi:hypothetical protein QJS04_geneDACA014711 [Acorus gramineus]|uniref:Uncharacterized protein n=1 Tax=Acorus gramineus TaxID=55184 RepID=A0AAV9B2M1_ACOGR|nr:hypothetical protein QJS04_geneDACA014711 [Acorus gramineus]
MVCALWEAGRRLKRKGDRSVTVKISQSFVPVVLWAVWLARNHRIFCNRSIYFENLWDSMVNFIRNWGLACAGARKVLLIGGKFVFKE